MEKDTPFIGSLPICPQKPGPGQCNEPGTPSMLSTGVAMKPQLCTIICCLPGDMLAQSYIKKN